MWTTHTFFWLLTGLCISFAILYIFQFYTLQYHLQIAPTDRLWGHPTRGFRLFEASPFQPLIINHKSCPIPNEHLDLCASAIEKHKHLAIHPIPTHMVVDQALQPVKTFAHIHISTVHKIPKCRAEGYHCNNSRIYEVLTLLSISSRIPLGCLMRMKFAAANSGSPLTSVKPISEGDCFSLRYLPSQYWKSE